MNLKSRIRCPQQKCVYNHHGICYCQIVTLNEELKCVSYEEDRDDKGILNRTKE